jgi:AraC-like DNA-binding protein
MREDLFDSEFCGTWHRAELSEVSYISILISKEFFEGMMAKTGYNMCGFLLEFDLSHKLNNLMHLFKDEVTSNPANGECIRNISALIAAELLIAGSGARNQARSEYHYIKTVKETADYINNNVSQDVSIDELASLCNMSRYHYIRTFKKCFGVPPYKYLIKARLSIAKLLLESTNLSMTEISLKSGFLTPNRFSEVFKQNMNMTPTEYRRLFNKNYRPTIK